MAPDDIKTQAMNSSHDFYALLEITEGAQENEIRRAYRKTALKYHPDKVGTNQAALDKFHLLQIGYDVLSNPAIKELYDNARRARQARTERDKAYEGRRKWMKDDLERRENGAFKRKREDVDAENEYQRELRRLAADGKRRREERAEALRKEELEEERRQREGEEEMPVKKQTSNEEVDQIDRSITFRFPHDGHPDITKATLTSLFSRFGPIEDIVLRDKKLKPPQGQKHRQRYTTVAIAYQSVVGAHAAVSDFPDLRKSESEHFGIFEGLNWARGSAPDSVPSIALETPGLSPRAEGVNSPVQNGNGDAGIGSSKVPSFGSFKGTAVRGQSGSSLDEITLMRLKNAQKRRNEEERIRKEEAAES